jgi:hypothetical protein
VVAVAVDARGRGQCGQPINELQGREAKLLSAIGLRPGQAIDELVVAELLELSARNRRLTAAARLTDTSGVPLNFPYPSLAFEAVGGPHDRFARYVKDEIGRWAKVVKETGAKPE